MEVSHMAAVSGRLRFDRLRTANPTEATQGIAGVPIVLQNTATNAMLAVMTDAEGNYTFTYTPFQAILDPCVSIYHRIL